MARYGLIFSLLLLGSPATALAQAASAVTVTSTVDDVQIQANGVLDIRTRTDVTSNGTIIGSVYKNTTLAPGSSTTGVDPRVAAVAAVVWTPAVIAAYQAAQSAP